MYKKLNMYTYVETFSTYTFQCFIERFKNHHSAYKKVQKTKLHSINYPNQFIKSYD